MRPLGVLESVVLGTLASLLATSILQLGVQAGVAILVASLVAAAIWQIAKRYPTRKKRPDLAVDTDDVDEAASTGARRLLVRAIQDELRSRGATAEHSDTESTG